MIWVVGIETTAPAEAQQCHSELSECIKELHDHEVAGSIDADGWMIQVSVTAGDSVEALTLARNLIMQAAANADLPYWPEMRLSIVNSARWCQRRSRRSEAAGATTNSG